MDGWEFCNLASCGANWLFAWQTLIAGILAIIAAGFTIHQTARIDAGRRRGTHRAARATLPLALSGICAYAQAVADALANHLMAIQLKGAGPVAHDGPPLSVPTVPSQLVPSLERVVESALHPSVAARLADLIGEIQVLDSRMHGQLPDGDQAAELYLEDQIIKAAVVYALSSSLFDFARRSTERPTAVSWGEVRSALNIMHLVGNPYERLRETVARRGAEGVKVVER